MMNVSPAKTQAAHRQCAEIVRASNSSFAAAFWMLARDQRRALHAIYAFCRLADDIADDEAIETIKREVPIFCPVAKVFRQAGTQLHYAWTITRP